MKTEKTTVIFPDKTEGKGLLWGNNAAWICKCGELLGNRTADGEHTVHCECGRDYEIERAPNKNGKLNLGAATGIKCCK